MDVPCCGDWAVDGSWIDISSAVGSVLELGCLVISSGTCDRRSY